MRYIILFFCFLVQLCVGGIYAWTVFADKLVKNYAFTQTRSQIIFSAMIFTFTLAMIPAGRILGKINPSLMTLLGGLLFSLGYLLASFSGGDFYLILIGIGVIAGIGTGMCYISPLAVGVRWFPDKKGLVTGIVVCGFGSGAILLVYLTNYLSLLSYDVLKIFKMVGISYGIILILSSFILKFPKTSDLTNEKNHNIQDLVPNFLPLIEDKRFLLLLAGIFAGTFAGLMVIGNLKSILSYFGVSTELRALAVSIFAIGNASGRIVWGWIYDKIAYRTIVISLFFLALALLLFYFLADEYPLSLSLGIGFGFGACFVLYASQTATWFGPEKISSVYPALFFLGYGLAGILGPLAGGFIYDKTKSYDLAIFIAVAILTLSGLLIACGSRLLLNAKKST